MATPASTSNLAANEQSAPAPHAQDRRLRLEDILKLMVADGLVAAADAEKLSRSRSSRGDHPLEFIAAQKWKAATPPHVTLTLDWLPEGPPAKPGAPLLPSIPPKKR